MVEVMGGGGYEEVETHFYHLQNTFAQFIFTRPIMDLGLAAEHCTGSRVFKRWWEQHCLDLDEIRMAAW